jgi:hypothetical protein
MEEFTQQQLPDTRPKRPNMLTILCILTFIGSGMQLFSSLVIASFYDLFVQIAQEFAEKFKMPGMEQFREVRPLFFVVSAFLYAGSVTGAILMMKMKKTGFHVYAIFQILLILSPMYFLHLSSPGTFDILLAGLFIFLYSMNMKFMS